jgi:two-component system, NarL family, response regulator NreC
VPLSMDAAELAYPSAKIRCVLAHDHVLLRQGLRRLLEDEPDIDVVGEAGDAAECLRKVYELRPDVVVVDAQTLGLQAVEVELCVTRESPSTKIVFLSTESSAQFVGLQATSGGCNVRQTSAEELAEMVRSSCRNHRSDSAESLESDPQPGVEAPSTERALTTREREVLKLLAEGKTVRGAASLLGVSSKTVDSHKFNLMRKLGIHNKAELVMWAVQKRVVKVPLNL